MIPTVVISLSPERLKPLMSQLEGCPALLVHVQKGFIGKQVIDNSKLIDRTAFEFLNGREMTSGEAGCALAHFSVYQKIFEHEWKWTLVLEDNARLLPGAESQILMLIEAVESNENLRGVPQSTSPPQISSPLTQGTDTQLELPMQQPGPTSPLKADTSTGTPPMATNPLSQMAVTPAAAYTPAPVVGTASSGGGSFTQGAPLPNITTTQQQVTAAPEFYTDYLNQLAKQGASTAQSAKYVGATDLQNQAFDRTSQNVGNYEPTLQSAINMAQNVGSSNLSEAIGNLGQANIARNLAPQATAGIVGSGQFGSKRGAAALGDTIANAQLGITAQQATALQQDMQNRLAAAQQLGNLASSTQQLGLGDINALATMGGQKQTIAQNEQLFPMQQLTNQSQLLRGYTIPTSTGSSYTGPIPGAYAASPLQQIAGLGALGAGISQTKLGDAIGRGLSSSSDAALTALSKLFNISGTGTATNETNLPPIRTPDGRAATPNGDGSYTTSDGQIVGVDGNPIPGSGGTGTDRDFDFIDDDNVYPGFPE